MKDLGITKGKWKSIYRNKHDRGVRSDKGFICFMTMPQHYQGQDARYDEELNECRSNADLICDAGNTAQKCGLLPSELLNQRDELLAMMEKIAVASQIEGELLAAMEKIAVAFQAEREPYFRLADVNDITEAAIKSTE